MRVLIDNSGYELRNFGDLAMLQVAVKRVKDMLGNSEVFVFTADSSRLKTYCPEAIAVPSGVFFKGRQVWLAPWCIFGGLHHLLPKPLHSKLKFLEKNIQQCFPHLSRRWIEWRFRKKKAVLEEFKNYFSLVESSDIVIASGGGYINDTFEVHAEVVLGTVSLAQSLKKPTFLFGQGIGPITSSKLLHLCKKVLPNLEQLCLRENASFSRLVKSLGIDEEKILVTGDDAIEIVRGDCSSKIHSNIGVNLRLAKYSEVGGNAVDKIRKIVLNAKNKYQASLIPVPISTYEADSDVVSLKNMFKENIEDSYFNLTSVEQVSENVAQCRIVITGSYHAGVFALSRGLQVIGLVKSQYYIDKFNGLADQFKNGVHIVDLSTPDFAEVLSAAIDKAWEETPTYRDSLLHQADQQMQLSKKGYQFLGEWKK